MASEQPRKSHKQTTHLVGISRQEDVETGQETAHEFEQKIADDKVTHQLRSLTVPSITGCVETRSPAAIQYVRDLDLARRRMEFRVKKVTGAFAVPKSGAKASTPTKAQQPIVCPDCDGWGVMAVGDTDKTATCQRCQGERMIMPT
jgi:hypothetical protein